MLKVNLGYRVLLTLAAMLPSFYRQFIKSNFFKNRNDWKNIKTIIIKIIFSYILEYFNTSDLRIEFNKI